MAFVVSAGQIASVERAVIPALPYTLRLTDTLYQSYETIWRTQPNVRTVVGFLARNIAQLGLHVFRRVSDNDRERLTDHPLAELIAQPLPPDFKITRYRLFNNLMHDLGIYDDGFWVKIRPDGAPAGLARIPPGKIVPIGDNWLDPEGYELIGSRGRRELPPDQVVHFFGYNPDDPRRGVPPIETLRRILAEEYAANQFREQLWRNGARMTGYIRRPADAPDWSKTARERFRADWQAQYAGDGPQTGGTPLLEDGMAFEQASFSPEQAQYLEARKLTREEVAAAYYIPPPMVGILDHATFSNITEQHKMLYQDTLGPWLTMLAEDIGLQLLPDLDDDPTIYVEFNIAEKLRGNFEDQARSIQALVGRPVLTANEGRALLNRNARGGDADELVTPLNVLVGGQASPLDSAPPQPEGPQEPLVAASPQVRVKARAPDTFVDKATQVLQAFFGRQRRSVTSRLGAKTKTGAKAAAVDEVWDGERWDRELSGEVFALSAQASAAAARKALDKLGLDAAGYDSDRTLSWLQAHASGVASGVNGTTREQLARALDEDDPKAAVRHVFEVAAGARAAQIAMTETTAMSGFGTREAVQQTGRPATKTWLTTSAKPRPSHAAISGETVDLDEVFSNGGRWPGDALLPEEDRAGCQCDLELTVS